MYAPSARPNPDQAGDVEEGHHDNLEGQLISYCGML